MSPPPPSSTATATASAIDDVEAPRRAWSDRLPLRSRRAAARARRWLGRALLVVPTIAVLAVDLGRRHGRLLGFEGPDLAFYLLSAAAGLFFWSSLVGVSTRPRGAGRLGARLALVVLALVAVGGQLYTYQRYHAYLNHRAVLVGTSFLPSIGQQLWFDRWELASVLLPCLALAIVLPITAARVAPMRSRARGWLCLDLALVALLIAAFVSPERGAEQGQPPDVMYVSAMGQLARARWDHVEAVERVHPGPRTPEPVPALTARPAARRNVVFVITESVRAQSVCLDYDAGCRWTPRTNVAAKDRIALTQMRALDSTTAISLGVMWTGLEPTASRAALHSAPLLWEYAHAASVASSYYTAQNLLFANSGTWLEGSPWTRHVSATMLDPSATYETGSDDAELVDYALADLDHLREPWIAVVHLSNTHFPYKIDPDDAPFWTAGEKSETTDGRPRNETLERYQDSIYLQDKAVARLVDGVFARPDGDHTVIVYVSDHGEQLRERGAVGHTSTLIDLEIRIPFWIAAAPGTLTAAEERSLRDLHDAPVTSLDVLPTVLDLVGVWDDPGLASFKPRMPGQSLLRGGSDPNRPVVMTNCSELFACAFKNWGAIQGTKKLFAHHGDRGWNCYDVASDPEEERPLDPAACGDLATLTERVMGGRPF